jgi:uncharacterized protein YndB with AHSA1/START domain
MDGDVVSVERVIPAGPAAIFALVSDASRHPEIDGSGTVRQVKPDATHQLGPGSTFGMSMKMGIPYSMASTVIEFEEDRRIAWQSRPPGVIGRFTAGRIWRYELEPVEGGTLVRESWDISQDHQRALLKLGGLPTKTAADMARTLERIEQLVCTT